ncbi:MAG: hypothetical protein KF900_05180 [Bacteroidetes bacterium]|nr:hypothetical protein [Bacteroidota bacterium]
MPKIDLHNYEAFLLDYLEGNLSEADIYELKSFALLHPELNIDFDGQLISITTDETKFSEKEQLKKNENEFLLNNRALLYVENLLTGKEKTDFENEIQTNETLKKEVLLFEKTKLPIDENIVYPNKEELKKETAVIFLFSARTWLAAASLLLIVGLSVLFINKNEISETKQEIAHSNNLPEKKNVAVENKQTSTKKIEAMKEQNNTSLVAEKKSFTKVLNNNPVATHDTVVVQEAEFLKQETNTGQLAISNEQEENTTQTWIAFEEDNEEQETENSKPNFWKRAVKVAKQINGLGFKAIQGEEKANDNFILSFNSLVIEKN